MSVLEIILLSFLAAFVLVGAIGMFANRRPRGNWTQGIQRTRKLDECEPKGTPLDPIKMKNGKDGMMWGGNNYTIKTKP